MADEIGMEADPRISVGGIEAETGESGDIQEPLHRPPPTIDDIEIPPPPPEEDVVPPPLEEQSPPPPVSGEQAPPPPLSEDTPAIKMPQEEDTPLPPPIHEDTPSGIPPQMESTPALTCGDHGDLEPIEVDEVPVAPEDQQVKDPQDVSEVHEVGVDQYPPTIDCGSPLPPYNDSGVDVPSMSTADASVLEGKELQSEIDEIQIEAFPDDASKTGIHNASTLPSKRSMGTITPTANQHSKLTGYIEMSPEETKAEMTRVSTYRREAVMWVTIFLMLAGAIAVIFYFTFNIVNLSDASLPDGQFRVRAGMLLDHPWEETLATSSTAESKELANNITYGINSTFTDQSSTFRDIFLGVDMFSFSNDDGGIRTSFQCIFGGSPSEDISTRHAFTELFIAELENGFDDENFFDLELSADESVDVFRFIKL